MSKTIDVKLTAGYVGTSDTRQYKITDVAEGAISNVKGNVVAFNASISGGTAGGVDEFFVSDSGARMSGIVGAQVVTTEITPIYGEVAFSDDVD